MKYLILILFLSGCATYKDVRPYQTAIARQTKSYNKLLLESFTEKDRSIQLLKTNGDLRVENERIKSSIALGVKLANYKLDVMDKKLNKIMRKKK